MRHQRTAKPRTQLTSGHKAMGAVLALLAVALMIAQFFWFDQHESNDPLQSYAQAKRAFQRGDHAEVLSICGGLLTEQSDDPKLLLMAGESASKLQQYPTAIQFYDRVSDSAGDDAAIARWAAGEVTLQTRQMSATIQRMEQALALDGGMAKARERLIYLLNLSGRRWEAFPHLLEMVRQNQWSVQQLLYLGNIAKPVENESELGEFLAATPQDHLPLLGRARIRLREGATSEAEQFLSKVQEQFPYLVEAHVQNGRLLQQIAPEQIAAWNRRLPPTADSHPEIWMIRGEWAREHKQPEAAARCFAESIRLDPDHHAAINALTQTLANLGQMERAKPLQQRATQLEKLSFVFERIMANEWSMRQAVAQNKIAEQDYVRYMGSPNILEPIVAAAQQTLDLGRYWEAHAWSRYGLSFVPSHVELQRISHLAAPFLGRQSARTILKSDLIDSGWAQSLPLPHWDEYPERTSSLANKSKSSPSSIRFTDVGEELAFSYYASRISFEGGRRMFEMTGGGVGVLDYNSDGWPDLFLCQGSDWPPGSDASHSDRLKRNLGVKGGSGPVFEDVSPLAGISDRQFGQGVAIGDVDSDGFDDVFVCNFGVNQLWLNQGDGTFRDGSTSLELLPGQWTVSAAVADLNNDGLAEIYEANYVDGDDVATRRCLIKGIPRACSPLNFHPAKGRLMAVDEQGVFRQVPESLYGDSISSGNALGLVVLRLKDHKLPAIFIANDQVANLMLSARPDAGSPLGIRYEDQALISGVAYDGEGKAQACMGVAAADVNRDGTIDLLVTNYFDETNTLYLQESNGNFRDASRSSGLVAPSLKMLGFGAQFLDAQNDGAADLVVLNGHIDDMTHAGMGYRMQAQLFLADGPSRWLEQNARELGPYFEEARLGRALALIDFNRDGRQDFVATDLERPTSLLRNDSQTGNFLTIRLVGTASHRDAIGTEVKVSATGAQWTQQLVAGCGYMASNEKLIHFGLGSIERVDRLEIDWPSGNREIHSNLAVNTHWIAVENVAFLPTK